MVRMTLRASVLAGCGRLAVRMALALVVATLALDVPTARGGEDPLAISASLGIGMHAYHAGDYQRSYDELSAVIEAGSRDPRAYYFRGLAALKLGRTDEAEADFEAGAAREAVGRGTWSVSRSLERVQGCDRLTLERHRARARLVALQRDREAEARRYAPAGEGEDVLRGRRPETIPREGSAPRPDAEGAAAEELPAGNEAGDAEAEPAAEPSDKSDPFGDEPADDEEPAAKESDQQAEAEAVEAEDTAAQADQREEELNAEAEDAAAQQDEREEMEDAGEKAAEEVQDGTTSLDRGAAPGQGA